jgi:hypothetical protein
MEELAGGEGENLEVWNTGTMEEWNIGILGFGNI